MWDRTGETQVYDQPQKVAEEQKRFGKELALSRTASRTFVGALYHISQPGLALAAVPSGLRPIEVETDGRGEATMILPGGSGL
jgi:hypothetical protein